MRLTCAIALAGLLGCGAPPHPSTWWCNTGTSECEADESICADIPANQCATQAVAWCFASPSTGRLCFDGQYYCTTEQVRVADASACAEE